MDNKYKLISAIIQLVLALVLVGIGVYYFFVDQMTNFILFLIVGLVFIGLSVRTIIKWYKDKKDEGNEENKE